MGPLGSLAAGMTLTKENSYRPATHCIKAAPKKSRGNSLPATDRIGNLIIVTTPTSQHYTVQIGIRDVPGSVRQSPLKGAGLWRSIVQRYPHRQGYAQIKIVLQFLLSKSDKATPACGRISVRGGNGIWGGGRIQRSVRNSYGASLRRCLDIDRKILQQMKRPG